MFDPVEKNWLIGAFATGAVKLGLEAYYQYMTGIGQSPAGQPIFSKIYPALPSNDEFLACAGFPLLVYVLGKAMKKESVVQMSKGGGMFGVSTLIGETVYETVRTSQPATARYRLVPLR
jgi:hypothetical protein